MQEALTALLLADAPLTALVGTRVHWQRLPEGVGGWPYVILQTITDGRAYHMGGQSGLRQARVQIDVWADSQASALAVVRAVLGLLSGYRGVVAGIDFRGCFVVRDQDFTGESAGGARQLFRRSADVEISWRVET